jgi:DNA-binding IclR family transcriptional regulator
MPLQPSPAVVRATELLRHLAARPTTRFTVSDLARELDLPRATCDTLLLALAESELVRRDAQRRYELGPACISLGDAARVANPALRAAADAAENLARELGAFALVCIRDGDEVRVSNTFDFGPPLGLRARVGEAIPLVPPFGASFVAWSDEDEVRRWFERAEPPLDAGEERAYRRALETVRQRGFTVTVVRGRPPDLLGALERLAEDRAPDEARRARDDAVRQMTHSEYLTGALDPDDTVRVAQLAAPVFDGDGRVAAAIMVLGPNHDLRSDEVSELAQRMARAAATATTEAGGAVAHS